jgi:predicted DNA-binding transcriptional regulator AlpA
MMSNTNESVRGGINPGADPELATISEVCELVRKSQSQLRRLIKEGSFPSPIYVGSSPLWMIADLRQWLRNGAKGDQPCK